MKLSDTAETTVLYYGGMRRWRAARRIEAEVSVTGLAFVLKARPYF